MAGNSTPTGGPWVMVEGPECAGKTTLIAGLRSQFGFDVKYLGHQPGLPQFERYSREYRINERCVLNRGHVSEVLYSVVNDRPEPFSRTEQYLLDRELVERSAAVVFCDAPIALLCERLHSRNRPQPVDSTQLRCVQEAFAEYATRLSAIGPVIRYVSSRPEDISDLIRHLTELGLTSVQPTTNKEW